MAPPDQPGHWRYWYLDNRFSHGQLSSLELKTWIFRPPANARAIVMRGPVGTSRIAVSLSDCPGKYLELPSACRQRFGVLHWSTIPGDEAAGYCVLEAGRIYFLNAASFDLEALIASGGAIYDAGPACSGQQCAQVELYQARTQLPPQ